MIVDLKTGLVAMVICILLLGILIQPGRVAAEPSPAQDRSDRSPPTPPPPRQVFPNASRITGTIHKYSVWPPGSLKGKKPPVPPDQTLYSFRLEVLTSDRVSPELGSHAWPPGIVIEAFSAEPLSPDLVGKQIEATLTLTGDREGVRWFISNVRAF